MLRIAICDDEKLHRDYTQKLTSRALSDYLPEIDTFDCADALLRAMNAGDYLPDIAILDIQMDGMDGIALAKRLNELAPECRIVFLTGYLSYAPDVCETQHIYFVLKSEVESRIGAALFKAVESASAAPAHLLIKENGSALTLPLKSIVYFERRLRKTRIVCEEGEHFISQTPAQLLGKEAIALFVRSHQSFWVNREHIAAMTKDEFTVRSGEKVPISRSYAKDARAQYFEYSRNM